MCQETNPVHLSTTLKGKKEGKKGEKKSKEERKKKKKRNAYQRVEGGTAAQQNVQDHAQTPDVASEGIPKGFEISGNVSW